MYIILLLHCKILKLSSPGWENGIKLICDKMKEGNITVPIFMINKDFVVKKNSYRKHKHKFYSYLQIIIL